jgi:hypothetical protein
MFGDRLNRSWQIVKESYRVLVANPALLIFPVLSGIAVLIVSIPFFGIMAASGIASRHHHFSMQGVHYLVTALSYFANYLVIVFFNSALVACAHEALQGRKTTVGYGLQVAISRLPQIIGWAALAATVGTALRLIGERLGFVGTIVTGFLGVAWNIAVFFVVPELVIDKESPVSALKKSTAMLKDTWGERLVVGVGAGYSMIWVVLLGMIPVAAMIFFLSNNMLLLGAMAGIGLALYIVAVCVIFSAITTIFQTALYLYCRDGKAPIGFGEQSMQAAFAVKPQRKIFGRLV